MVTELLITKEKNENIYFFIQLTTSLKKKNYVEL